MALKGKLTRDVLFEIIDKKDKELVIAATNILNCTSPEILNHFITLLTDYYKNKIEMIPKEPSYQSLFVFDYSNSIDHILENKNLDINSYYKIISTLKDPIFATDYGNDVICKAINNLVENINDIDTVSLFELFYFLESPEFKSKKKKETMNKIIGHNNFSMKEYMLNEIEKFINIGETNKERFNYENI